MPNPFNENNGNFANSNNNPSMSINDIYKTIVNSKNPMETFNFIAKNNPKLAPITELLNKGYSPEAVFNIMCKQRGINPQEFLKNLSR